MTLKKIKVLIVDDSALVRQLIIDALSKDPQIEIIGAAPDAYAARDIMITMKPDVITLDVDMPRIDGLSFLKKYINVIPTPTIMVSAYTEKGKKLALDALDVGAVEIVTKPSAKNSKTFPLMMEELKKKIKMAAKIDMSNFSQSKYRPGVTRVYNKFSNISSRKIIALGTSTGGTEALNQILPAFPSSTPGMAIVQHMPEGFTNSLAERLNSKSSIEVKEAEHGDIMRTGLAVIAPGGNRHMKIKKSGGQYRIELVHGPHVSSHRPSVDVFFTSMSKEVGKNSVAVLMTGMGKDGAEGLLKISQAGGRTFVQDERTSVVWGMPKVGWELGAAESKIALESIPLTILNVI